MPVSAQLHEGLPIRRPWWWPCHAVMGRGGGSGPSPSWFFGETLGCRMPDLCAQPCWVRAAGGGEWAGARAVEVTAPMGASRLPHIPAASGMGLEGLGSLPWLCLLPLSMGSRRQGSQCLPAQACPGPSAGPWDTAQCAPLPLQKKEEKKMVNGKEAKREADTSPGKRRAWGLAKLLPHQACMGEPRPQSTPHPALPGHTPLCSVPAPPGRIPLPLCGTPPSIPTPPLWAPSGTPPPPSSGPGQHTPLHHPSEPRHPTPPRPRPVHTRPIMQGPPMAQPAPLAL